MNKVIYITLLVTCVIGLSSCRGSSGQKAVKLAKEYLGKTVSGAKKSHLERYAADVARVKFTKVKFQRVSPAPPTAPDWGYKIYL